MLTATKSPSAATQPALFDKAAVEKIITQNNEPDWLAHKRRIAWSVFEDTPMPTTSDEAWRRTGLKRVKWNQISPDAPTAVQPVAALQDLPQNLQDLLDANREAAGRLLFVNGQLKYSEIDESLAQQGVIFTDLQSAARQHADLLKAHLMNEAVPPADGKFAALNAALWRNGVFLYLPRNVTIAQPFQAAFLLDGEGAASIHRALIIAESGAQADYIEESASQDNAQLGLNVGVVEIIARDNAQIRYVDAQQLGQKVYNFNTKRALAHANSRVLWDLGEFGSGLTKTFIDTQLIGNGADTQCNGVYFLDGTQHVDIDTMMHHIGYATTGDLLLHGALKDKARSVFLGMIKIDPSGQKTDSYLKNQNMLLDETTRADSIPALEIDANDVRASHAATISQVEDEYVFYLQSRGIPRDTAVKMIVEGFFSTVFNRMGNERVQERLMATVQRKMG
ncbi:MAG TPA: Fe-S cluster assembly protein SufD [Anaerolineae bacterium]|nr:Fe-S cluster assembly protein SufD [Anaerolineae bacterium]